MKLGRFGVVLASGVSVASATACSSSDEPPPACDAPAGALRDVNPSSPSFDDCIVQADYAGQVSAWYFGFTS